LLDPLRRVRSILPQGTFGVGGGLLLLGVSSYIYLTVSTRALDPNEFAALSVLYTLVFTIGPGLFLPLEQELGRAIAHRRTLGEGGGPVVRKAVVLAAALLVTLLVAGTVLWRPMSDRLFDGSDSMQAALLVSMVTLFGAHLTRGGLAGLGKFPSYGRQFAVEGTSRALLCITFVVVGVHAVGWYGWLLPVGLGLSVLATGRHARGMLSPGVPAEWAELSQALALLLVSTLMAQLLVNAGPIVAKLQASGSERAAAGRLLAGMVLTRIPLFLFGAVQAALLPGLAAALGRGDREAFLRGLRRLTAGLAALCLASVVGAATLGPELMRLLFGARYELSAAVMAGLAGACAFYILTAVFVQSLVALRRYGYATVTWLSGVIVFFVALLLPGTLITRVTVAFVLGAGVALSAALVLLVVAWRLSGRPVGAEPDFMPVATVET
jgi:O-antigen/teichoic acid export membrane protein